MSSASSSSVASSIVPRRMPSAASAGRRLVAPEARLRCREREHALADLAEGLLRGAAVRCAHRRSRDDLVLEARDPHHEELVEDRRDDPAELDALEQRLGRVGGEVEHAPDQVELGQLAVQERRGCRRRRNRLLRGSHGGVQRPRNVVNGGLRFGDRARRPSRMRILVASCGTTGSSPCSPSQRESS